MTTNSDNIINPMSLQDAVNVITNEHITQEDTEKSIKKHESERAGLYNKHYAEYANTIPKIVIWYLCFVGFILFLNGVGFSCHQFKFYLSDSVIITLLGTTTINILGLMYIVAKHLFPNSSKEIK